MYKNNPHCIFLKKAFLIVLPFITTYSFAQNDEKFFAKKDLMPIGSYYYPDQWPREYWARDIKKMAEVGFDFTHYGEFAWAFIEPEDGKFDFKWLDEAVELSH